MGQQQHRPDLAIRRVEENDAHVLWVWRNAPDVRATALNPEEIAWETHSIWFERKLTDPRCTIMIGEVEGEPVGQVRIDILDEPQAAEVSISLDRAHRGKGFGSELLKNALRLAFERLRGVEEMYAYIKETNEPSLKLFRGVGFEYRGNAYVRGAIATKFVLTRDAFVHKNDWDIR
jgi:UDP-2,4-diacetamido-2,4,6-trideoxy-beta-L-altropyranose hydrolase